MGIDPKWLADILHFERDTLIDAVTVAKKTSVLCLRLEHAARPELSLYSLLPSSQREFISLHLSSDRQSISASVMAYVNSLLQFDDESFALELQLEEMLWQN